MSRATGLLRCRACVQRWRTCSACRRAGHIGSGTLDRPVCPDCTSPASALPCPGCGRSRQIRAATCEGCNLRARLVDLLGGGTGTVRPDLLAFHDSLLAHERPATLLRWLARPHVTAALADLGAGRLAPEHAAFDALPAGKPADHLRAMLVATGVLPERDEHLARLERWISATISEHPEAQLLHRYAVWHLLRRLRHRTRTTPVTAGQATVVRTNLTSAIAVLDWATARGQTLATLGQADLDAWLATPEANRVTAGHFARWARRQKLTTLRYPATGWNGPAGPIDTAARWTQARRLLHDDTLHDADRVAGLLILLYAQHVSALTRLTVADVTTDGDRVRLRLGPAPIELPEPLAGLVLALAATRHGHAALTDEGASPWLFPGGTPGRPLSASRLAERVRAIGVRARAERSTALFTLAAELPAALLAQMLGIHITGAVKWQRTSAGDWTRYAADYARRDPPRHTHDQCYSETSDI